MGIVQNVLRWNDKKTPLLDTVFIWLLVVTLFGVVLHAPFSVGVGTLFPEAALFIKSWKELFLGVAGLLLVVILTRERRWNIFNTKIFYLILSLTAVLLVLVPFLFTGPESTLAGILIDVRYFFAFALVYAAVRLYPKVVQLFLAAITFGAVIVVGFATLQLTVLPHDVLKHIGYGASTIQPYMTVDENMDYIRINSTLRGPNPLGAYAAIIIIGIVAFWLRFPRRISKKVRWMLLALGVGAAAVVWASYSRSAALATVIGLGIVTLVVFGGRITKTAWISLAVVALVLGGSLVAARDTSFVSTVILHEDPSEGGAVNSNDEHVSSLKVGVQRMLAQPFGAGIGSTGSASLSTDAPLIIENQYLFIAHEVGWVGLMLFIAISVVVLAALWRRRHNWLCLGVFASGVGLACIGIVLPVWVDDTVAIVWWSLAAIALALPLHRAKESRRV